MRPRTAETTLGPAAAARGAPARREPAQSGLLADAVFVAHAALAAPVVAGLVFTLVGNPARWHRVSNFRLRLAHPHPVHRENARTA